METGLDEKCQAEYKRIIGSHNVVLLCTTGSRALGIADANSDTDEIGVFIEAPKKFLGFNTEDTVVFRTAEYRTGAKNTKSEPYDIDLTLYGLRKFVQLAIVGNPTIVNVLYTPPNMQKIAKGVGLELLRMSNVFAGSKAVLTAFLGFLRSEMAKINNLPTSEYPDPTRIKHVVRLAIQLQALLTRGNLTLPLEGNDFSLMHRALNTGITVNALQRYLYDVVSRAEATLADSSMLYQSISIQEVERLMIAAYLNTWNYKEQPAEAKTGRIPWYAGRQNEDPRN